MNKRNIVLAVVKMYVSEYPDTTFAKLKGIFPDHLQGSLGVIKPVSEIHKKLERSDDVMKRYFIHDLLTSSDGVTFAVCNQWGEPQFSHFQKHISEHLNWAVEEINY